MLHGAALVSLTMEDASICGENGTPGFVFVLFFNKNLDLPFRGEIHHLPSTFLSSKLR